MKLLKNIKDINAFQKAIEQCQNDVMLYNMEHTEEFNLKSVLSRYIALGRLCEEQGDNYEVYCLNPADEAYLLKFFYELNK